MTFLRANLLSFVALLIMITLSLLLYDGLPERLPSHFSLSGEVDGTLPRQTMSILLPGFYLGLMLLINLLVRISPHKFSMPNSKRAMDIIVFGVGILFCFLHVGFLKNAGDFSFFVRYFSYGMALFLIITGNVFGKTERNFFVGLRTPWTLASAANWKATHRLAARLMVAMGAVLLISNSLWSNLLATLVLSVSPLLIPLVYSYLYFNARERNRHSI